MLVSERTSAADSSKIISAIDKLSKRLRERMGESLRAIRAAEPLEQVTTGSLEALAAIHRVDMGAYDLPNLPRAAAGQSIIQHEIDKFDKMLDAEMRESAEPGPGSNWALAAISRCHAAPGMPRRPHARSATRSTPGAAERAGPCAASHGDYRGR